MGLGKPREKNNFEFKQNSYKTKTDKNGNRVGIEGLSRYGKAAIVAMTFETRIAIGFIGSSGAGGTKILHRVFGE